MATKKQKAVQSRMKRAAKTCKGKKKTAFRACMKRELKSKKNNATR